MKTISGQKPYPAKTLSRSKTLSSKNLIQQKPYPARILNSIEKLPEKTDF
jgi:hypothetical protein